jgi:hypothetical protein
LAWLAALALLAITLIALVFLTLTPLFRSIVPGPATEETTGIPPEILEPPASGGGIVVIDVTRPPETEGSEVDFIVTVRPEATLPDLAADLGTSVETLQALNPLMSGLPLNSTMLVLVGQPETDAQLVVTSSQASVQDQPAQQAQVLEVLSEGTFAAVLGRTTDYRWFWIDTGQNRGWLAGQDVGLIYPTVPDGLPVIARVQIVAANESDN